MKEIVKNELCCGCGVCENICPSNSITMVNDKKGFYYPLINTEICIECGLCKEHCPIINEQKTDKVNFPRTFAFVNEDISVKKNSSSGGAFWCIAEYVIKQGGSVYGAAFTEDFRNVEHIEVTTLEELTLLQGSKYIQSQIGKILKKIEVQLKAGNYVLFSGTPCEVAALRSYLRQDYEKLICIDFICHGIPSSLIWQKYLHTKEINMGAKCVNVKFRSKTFGWKKYSLLMQFQNGKTYEKIASKDPYMQVFLSDVCLRESCYQCQYRGVYRQSDITLADFWGVQRICPEMYDEQGTSLVFLHSILGEKIFGEITEHHRSQKVNYVEALESNPSMIVSPVKPKERDDFLQDITYNGFDSAYKKFVKKTIIKKILKKLKRYYEKK